uniref:RING-type domain-containing protein n=1 Tax=Spongospora subterranea TaxID=70186 RepID=A0A0H5R0S1_9EUKA|eukprot:CRZ01384.1 hypothetical protein [Spongospora subterranea]
MTIVTVPAREINPDLTCPVCLSIINETWTVKECLHRFCQSCIETAIRLGSKQCPACRVSCPSRRSLRPDKGFDAIISAFYPDLAKQEEEHIKFVQEVIQAHNSKAFAISAMKGVSKQDSIRRKSKGRVSLAEPQAIDVGIFKRPMKKTKGRKVRKPVQLCLQRHEDSVDCGPRIRQFFDAPRSACVSQLTEFVLGWLPESVNAIEFYAVRNSNIDGDGDGISSASSPSDKPVQLERIDPRNRLEDLEYYFNSGCEGELLLVYTNAD